MFSDALIKNKEIIMRKDFDRIENEISERNSNA